MEAENSSEPLVHTYETTRGHVTENSSTDSRGKQLESACIRE
jgi:hypothetical protein